MSNIDVMKLDSKLRSKVEKAGLFSISKILLLSQDEFLALENFTFEDVKILKEIAGKSICCGFEKVSSLEDYLKRKWKIITFDCPEIDEILGGGIQTRGITEIFGESAAGKTQFCLQFSITVQYPVEDGGLGCNAIYICTEDKFPSSRLHQMASHFPRGHKKKKPDNPNFFKDNIYVKFIPNSEALKECLHSQLPNLLKKTKVGLIIIDSIAGAFRSDYTVGQTVTRAKDLRDIGFQLHKIANHFGLAVLCVNQVSDAIDQGNKIPALGLAWANLVTTKIQLTISSERTRTFQLITAPHLPPRSIPYKITASGILPAV